MKKRDAEKYVAAYNKKYPKGPRAEAIDYKEAYKRADSVVEAMTDRREHFLGNRPAARV